MGVSVGVSVGGSVGVNVGVNERNTIPYPDGGGVGGVHRGTHGSLRGRGPRRDRHRDVAARVERILMKDTFETKLLITCFNLLKQEILLNSKKPTGQTSFSLYHPTVKVMGSERSDTDSGTNRDASQGRGNINTWCMHSLLILRWYVKLH